VIKKPFGGIPAYLVFNITGVSDTGKSLMVEQFAVKRASEGKSVAFITVKSPAFSSPQRKSWRDLSIQSEPLPFCSTRLRSIFR